MHVTIGGASVAVRGDGPSIDAATAKPLTCSGRRQAVIPPGAVLFSDPVDVAVPAFADLAVDLYVPGEAAGPAFTMHTGANQTNYLSETGNHVGATMLPVARETLSWYFLSRIEVMTPETVGAVVTFGDSGNRVLADGTGPSALARFDRDVPAQTGATHVVVMEAINDIGRAREEADPTPADLIAGYQQIIARAHAHGLRIVGATLTPYIGAAHATPVGEAKRQAVNQWIRTGGGFDLHFTDEGYQKMAEPVRLDLFTSK